MRGRRRWPANVDASSSGPPPLRSGGSTSPRKRGEEIRPNRLASAPRVFAYLTALAARRERVAYSDFAFDLGLGSPRSLGWLLGPLYDWCVAGGLPLLPIIVVRRADGLPSGGYDLETIASETARVHDFDWTTVISASPADLARFSLCWRARLSREGEADALAPSLLAREAIC